MTALTHLLQAAVRQRKQKFVIHDSDGPQAAPQFSVQNKRAVVQQQLAKTHNDRSGKDSE